MTDPKDQFRQAMAAAGLQLPSEIIDDGVIHRFSSGSKPHRKNGWYVLYNDEVSAGAFGDWSQGFTQSWFYKTSTVMTDAERITHLERVERIRRQREKLIERRQQYVADQAIRRWNAATSCERHKYLTCKGIQPHGIKLESADLLIPLRDSAGKVHSLQTIAPDGSKRFMPGGRVKGCYYAIGKPQGVLIVCEGFATGASIFECTGHAVAVAFNAGNLEAVAVALRRKYPDYKIVVAADDDDQTPGNPGLSKAKLAVSAASAVLAAPAVKRLAA
ncbi:Archaeal primase DnaG/twinkle, TOPRIM domain [Comamonadaceae bacterium]